jgi:peptide/nickel transport system substrate-binding protein
LSSRHAALPRRRPAWLACACAAALTLTLALGACGGGENDRRSGGTIVVSATTFPDFLDPALAYSQIAWQALWTVYTPLLTYAHAEGAAGTELVPGLAEALPRISADGKTYRLRLRSGLTYSDGTPVKASDFEHTIKRVLNLESGGSSYFEPIVGAEEYVEARRPSADIAGIATDDATGDITIRLTSRQGSFSNVLALDFAGLVPGDTPFENLTRRPPPGVGPYRLDNVMLNHGYDLEKVHGFAVGAVKAATLDRITLRIVKNRRRQTQDALAGKIDYMADPPAPDQLRMVRDRFGGTRYREFATASTYFFFLNERVAPFDDVRVRRAVNYAIDRRAIPRLFGGLLTPSCNFLPPEIKGYEKLDPCPYGDAPDLAKARSLVRQAGATGEEVSVYSPNELESSAAVEYLADVLSDIGLKGRPRIIDASVYLATVGSQRTKAQAGFVAFVQDFPHPANFTPLIDGRAIQATNSTNPGNVDDRKIDAMIERASASADLDAVADDYAAVDRRLVEQAYIVPFGNRKLTVLYSDRIDTDRCTLWHPVYTVDLTRLCLR